MLFKWCEKCEFAFQSLKDALYDEPILQLPDPQWPYVLFTDTSKYAWAGVLCILMKRKMVTMITMVTIYHPVTYFSGLFRGSQLNWAAQTKEAYAVYSL